jgi:L-threonylcarbamoyladenylate synthase
VLSTHLARAVEIIHAGGVIAYPTEAVFGLGCDPLNQKAVEKVLVLKRRAREKGLILVAYAYSQLEAFIEPLDDTLLQRVMPTWPGPVTWLLPARPSVPTSLLGRFKTLAVRVTAHPMTAELCRQANSAIVSTSANLAGFPPAKTADAVRRSLGNKIDFVLEGPLGDSERPTEIRDGPSGRIIRPA